MATIAKSSITLVSISDAYSVSLQPSNITINADCKGNNPELANAKTTISLFCGDIQVPISQCNVIASSLGTTDKGCTLEKSGESYILTITSVEKQLSGWRDLEVFTEAGQRFEARFAYTIVRETSMLDWILEWNKEYTEISGDHVATPNAFIGSADENGKLSGVYIGGDMPDHPVGIYGIKGCDPTGFTQGNIADAEIFHLNENGGMIGGWDILPTGLYIENTVGKLQILSNGTIQYLDNNDATTPFWVLNSDGTGSLAHGNITWQVDGSATFKGRIEAASGLIAGWHINSSQIYNGGLIFDSEGKYIGLNATQMIPLDVNTGNVIFPTNPKGGVKIWYTSDTDFGFAGWSNSVKVFQLGSTNKIAGWGFDNTALFLGTKTNTAGGFTTNSGDITIGTEGLRGKTWYIDTNGDISFVNGLLTFDQNGGKIGNWTINATTLVTDHAALASSSSHAGLYLTPGNLKASLPEMYYNVVTNNGGIYLKTDGVKSEMKGYGKIGSSFINVFTLQSHGTCHISAWNFTDLSLYIGTEKDTSGSFTDASGSITLGSAGIRGFKWRLDATGAGAVAGGNISWDPNGKVTFGPNVKLDWAQVKNGPNLTHIDANGIYTGTISANNITAGTISSASIKCEGKWNLNTDGSGALASGNITWTADGELNVQGNIAVQTVRYIQTNDYFDPEIEHIVNDAFVHATYGGDCTLVLPHLDPNERRIIRYMGELRSRSGGVAIFKLQDDNDYIYIGPATYGATSYKEITCDVDILNFGLGYFDIVGIGETDHTKWFILRII